jgi:N-methylhydantoinase A
MYGRTMEGIDIEVLSWTLTISEPAGKVDSPRDFDGALSLAPAPGNQVLFDPGTESPVEAQVYLREALHPGDRVKGPALITEDQTTTVVTSAWVANIDPRGHILLERHS